MKFNKTMGRIATTLVATAMLASLAAPAYAEDSVPATPMDPIEVNVPGLSIGDIFTITKHLQVEENTFTPTKQFNFIIAPADQTKDDEKLTDDEVASGIEYGVVGGVDTVGHAYSEADPDEAVTGNGGKTVDIVSSNITVYPNAFDHAGGYKYIVTEQSFDNDDFKYDDNKLILYVNIANGEDGLKVAYVELVDPDAEGETDASKKTDGFTNKYGVDNNDKDMLHDVYLTKKITGDGANMKQKFTFTVTIDTEYDNNIQVIVDRNGDGQYNSTADSEGVVDEYIVLKDNVPATITLGNGETAKMIGLTDGASFTVVENEANKNGYTTMVTDGEGKEIIPTTGTVSGDNLNSDAEIVYINNRDTSTPTGIVMDIAPYALLVVVAAGACFFFMRKRRED